ncbi:MAG: polyprenyl synthetase family protein [Phycisphaeraceae bacterium]|nr:polyprenyl synthetase family protein [Phycisphaeraceae bacterium]
MTEQAPSASAAAPDLQGPARLVEQFMDRYLRSQDLPPNLIEAVAYSLLGPGKRLRPILVIRAAESVGASAEEALPAAAAIEMIHCFSLVHDDLPAMDDDDLRRGRPTLHRHTNEAMAILAGDLMMGLASKVVLDHLEVPLAHRVLGELVGGTNAMIAGQVYDTLGGFDPSWDQAARLEQIHRHKTGALILCSLRMGGLCGGADEAQLRALSEYGEAIGLMFQIVDDVLDVTATTQQLGKTAGKDVVQDKLTYPSVHGIDRSRSLIKDLQKKAHGAVRQLGQESLELGALCDYLAVRSK